jgi:hypothetical protein
MTIPIREWFGCVHVFAEVIKVQAQTIQRELIGPLFQALPNPGGTIHIGHAFVGAGESQAIRFPAEHRSDVPPRPAPQTLVPCSS